jgi:hypothetical protein
MTKYVEWIEPFDASGSIALICRLTVEDAIKWQQGAPERAGNKVFKYESDEQALEDFVTVHWARIVSASSETIVEG